MYVFADLETTGLDPLHDKILEVGILVLDDNLVEIDSFRQNIHYIPMENGKLRVQLTEKVYEMHTANRLWDACANSYMDAERVQNLAVNFMEHYKGEPLCGSTISFDRAFLKAQMPDLEAMFHYRNLDVSTFRVLFDKLGLLTPAKREAHRALADCRESVANLRYYMQQLGLNPVDENFSD